MFPLVRVLITKGALIDSIYARMTPLCAALTCGKRRSGDVRMVRFLLNAKADVNKLTFGPRFSTQKLELTHLQVAKEYSNKNCLQSIQQNKFCSNSQIYSNVFRTNSVWCSYLHIKQNDISDIV